MTEFFSQPVAAIHGEAVAGEGAAIRSQLEAKISNLTKSKFDIGELLSQMRHGGYYTNWGFETFADYVKSLEGFKERTAQYLIKIVDVMKEVGKERTEYEPLGIGKLREITSLDPNGTWVNPATNEETSLKGFIIEFVEKGADMTLEEIKTHVRTLKGLVGENDLTWLNVCLKRTALDSTVRPALEMAKNHIGSVGKDDDGNYKDASDGAALEMVAAEYLSDPANNVLPEDTNEVHS